MKKRWVLVIILATTVFVITDLIRRREKPIDIEAESAAISDMAIEWSRAAEAKDVDRMVSMFSGDASLFPPNAPIATGQEAIRTVWSQMVESPGFAGSAQTTMVEIGRAGDLAYSAGTYQLKMNDPEGNPISGRGKWVAVWKKQPDATWKEVAGIWNSDQPPPAPAAKR